MYPAVPIMAPVSVSGVSSGAETGWSDSPARASATEPGSPDTRREADPRGDRSRSRETAVPAGREGPSARAIPKSATTTRPSRPMRTFSGLKSRWTIPAACAAASPRPDSLRAASASLHGCPSRSHALQVLPVDELHRDEHAVSERADVVHREDVRVGEARHRLGLAQEARLRVHHRRFGAQDLDRHAARELRVVGGVHRPHSPRADAVDDHVAPDQRTGREGERRLGARLGLGPTPPPRLPSASPSDRQSRPSRRSSVAQRSGPGLVVSLRVLRPAGNCRVRYDAP